MENFNHTSDAASWLHNGDGLEFDSDLDFYSKCFQYECSLSVESCFLPNINKEEFEENINFKKENNQVNNNNTVLPEVENQYYLADSNKNELDLIKYITEPVSPTPSSATSASSVEQFLINNWTNEDFSKVSSNSLQMSQTVTDQQNLQTLIPTSADNTESSMSATTINNETPEVTMQGLKNYWNFVPRQSQDSTINELTTQTSLNRSQQTNVVTNKDFLASDNQPVYTTLQNCSTNETDSLDSRDFYARSMNGADSPSSTLPSPSPLESQSKVTRHSTRRERNNDSLDSMSGNDLSTSSSSTLPSPIAMPSKEVTPSTWRERNNDSLDSMSGSDLSSSSSTLPSPTAMPSKEVTLSTRRERNNKASKKLRMKRKRKGEDLNAQEELKKKQKQDLEKKADALKIQVAETYKSLKMLIDHSAQDNPSRYKQMLSAVLDQHQTLKQDSVCNKACTKVFKYFECASLRFSPAQQVEIMDWLEQQQQQQQQG